MYSPPSSRVYNSPSRPRDSISSSQPERHSCHKNYDLQIFLPDQRPNTFGSSRNFTINIFTPSNGNHRRPRSRRFRNPTMSTHGDHIHDHRGGAEDNRTPLESSHFRTDQEGLNLLWCRWSATDTNTDARQYEFLLEDIFQVFPQVARLGRKHFMNHDTFTVDQFLSRTVLAECPRQLLVEAYNFIFGHLLRHSPIYAKLLDKHAGHPDAVQRLCRDLLALSTLLSSLRGLGCGFYLKDDFLEALTQLWTEVRGHMNQEQQVSMFIANLEVFANVLKTEFQGPGSCTLDGFVAIWESLGGETQRVIEATVHGEARDYDTDERWDLWTAMERLIERSPIHSRPGGVPGHGGRPGPGGWVPRGSTPDNDRRPLWGGRTLGTDGGGEHTIPRTGRRQQSQHQGAGRGGGRRDNDSLVGAAGTMTGGGNYERAGYDRPGVKYEYERVRQSGGPTLFHERQWERHWGPHG